MNICVLYHGEMRTFKKAVVLQKKNLILDNPNYQYHILYTTWNREKENIKDFQIEYKNSYIKMVNEPNRDECHWDSRFKPHIWNPHLNGDVFPYFCQLYLWKEACKTLNEYEQNNNIKFDLVVRLRPDTFFEKQYDFTKYFYDYFNNINTDNIYVPTEHRFDIYRTGSVPDQICFGRKELIEKILNSLDIVTEVQQDKFVFHPETSLHNIMKYHHMNIIYLNFIINNDWWKIK